MSYFNNKFNKKNCNCPSCRGIDDLIPVEDIDIEYVEIKLDDPEEVVDQYIANILQASSEDEIASLIWMLFEDAFDIGYKQSLMDDIDNKVSDLNNYNIK